MASGSEREKLLGEEESVNPQALNTPVYFAKQTSIQFDISANSDAIFQLLQEKEFAIESLDTNPDSDQSDDEIISSDCITPFKKRQKQVSFSISQSGVQSYEHKKPALVLTENRMLTQTSNYYYGLLTICRTLNQKDLRKKLDTIGVGSKIETGSYSTHSSEDLYVLYEFKTQISFNRMCANLGDLLAKSIAKKTKKTDRIPMSLVPARPVYSKLKCCLELSLTPDSFASVIGALDPIFITLTQSLFYITADGTAEDDVTPGTLSKPDPNRLPAFALCLQFNKVIFPETAKSFEKNNWNALSAFPDNKSLFCYANLEYGEAMPYILCETGKCAGIHGSRHDMSFAIYLFVSGKEEAMLEMRSFYDTLLLSEKVKTFDSKRVVYPLLSDAYSDRELILIHVSDKTTVQQKAVSLYIHTTNILSLICKLQRTVTEYSQNCVCLYDPQGNRVVLTDLTHVPFFKNAVPKMDFTI